jgi:hypothetical protein
MPCWKMSVVSIPPSVMKVWLDWCGKVAMSKE